VAVTYARARTRRAATAAVDELADAYALCAAINREYGRSYYLATKLLPRSKRRHVHALYGFTRWTDEIVDAVADPTEDPAGNAAGPRAQRLREWSESFLAGLRGEPASLPGEPSGVPSAPGGGIISAVLDTITTFALPREDFEAFLRSMRMDLSVTGYRTYADLLAYMEGSAAAIGSMMLPILGAQPEADPAAVRRSARELGLAFQLTNFIRDVGEDLQRGRIYLPQEDLDRFGVTADDLRRDHAAGRASPATAALIAYECQRALVHYAAAVPGIELLRPSSRVCIRAAFLLYGGILGEVARQRYDVLRARARVPRRRRVAALLFALSSGLFLRRESRWRRRVTGPGQP
jgi:phytoene synthase